MEKNKHGAGRLPRVVVVGGGFAGLTLAQSLCKKSFEVLLIDRHNYHLFKPLLYQVASSALEVGSVAFPFRRVFPQQSGVKFCMAELQRVDAQEKKIVTSVGDFDYDYLVLATGCVPNFFGNNSLQRASIAMTELSDACAIRNQWLCHLEQATHEHDPQRHAALLRVVIVGGGASGVEIAGALADMRRYMIPREYPQLVSEEVKIYLIEGSPRLLASMSERTSRECCQVLAHRGVEVHLGVTAVSYEDGLLSLSTGETVATQNVVWTSGIRGEAVEGVSLESWASYRGRIPVDSYNRVEGMDGVFAIGDIAFAGDERFPKGYPQLARVAISQAKTLADNLHRLVSAQALLPYRYRPIGVLATVGRNRAFAEWRGWQISGFVAWLAWGLVHILFLLGVENKFKVFWGWVWNYLGHQMPVQLITSDRKQDDK